MASVQKFDQTAIYRQICHVERSCSNYNNPDIDHDKSYLDYSLTPDRDNWNYLKQRLSEVDVYTRKDGDIFPARKDIKLAGGWVITAPRDLDPSKYDDFFKTTYDFLADKYGERNLVSVCVHYDESGLPHLHAIFLPVVHESKNPKFEERLCMKEVVNRDSLRSWHQEYQQYLDAHGLKDAHVYTGITAKNGGNRSVAELKREREERGREMQREYTRNEPKREIDLDW